VGIFAAFAGMTTKDVFTLIIALYGAILSTVVLLRTVRKDKKKLRILLKQEGDNFECLVVNYGYRAINIQMPVITARGFSKEIFVSPPENVALSSFPRELGEGKSVKFTSSDYGITEKLGLKYDVVGKIVLSASCTDATGKTYRSKKLNYFLNSKK
jgi:hypothetical protein